MKRILPFLFLIFPVLSYSGTIPLDQALKVANNFFSSYHLNYEDIELDKVFTNDKTGENLIYVFKVNPKGFILVSADSNVEPILGFSDVNDFKSDNISPSSQEWITSYKEQIKYVKKKAIRNTDFNKKWDELINNPQDRTNIDNVGPLTVSKWHQGPGYNEQGPFDPECGNFYPPAGCVAIAMAQIIYYYKFPDYGTGSFSYNHSDYDLLSADFENTFYDYDKMTSDVINTNYAVAQLVSHCGISTKTNYQCTGSATSSGLVDNALIDYFNYSQDMEFATKANYIEDSEWEQLLKDNLDQNQILLYRGSAGFNGGHAWICDGYMDNNYFHFNFGWGGSQNGYFALDAIQVANNNFTSGQQAIINIYPDTVNYSYPDTQTEYVFTSLSGSFSDGSKAEDYQSNYEGSYLIDLSNDAVSGIFVQFDRINTETDKDIINIYAGSDENSELIASLSGQQDNISFEIPGSQAYVTFSTDNEANMNGWDLSYHSLPYCSSTEFLTTGFGIYSVESENFGIFTDGSGNLPYYSNSDCKWVIQTEDTAFDSVGQIIFEFNKFDVSLEDELIFYNGGDESYEIVATLSGNSPPDSLVVYSNQALIHFRTNQQQSNDGWELKFHTQSPIYCSDTSLYTSPEGSINDGSINSKWYSNNTDCYWRIAPPNAGFVELNFNSFETEYYYDYVNILDPSTNPPTLLRNCYGASLPEKVRSESGQMLIHFHADYAIRKQGWEVYYTSGETSIGESSLEKVRIYPNPAKEIITLEIPQELNDVEYRLFDILGNIILEKRSIQQKMEQINIQHIPNGLYILQLKNSNSVISRKITKSD